MSTWYSVLVTARAPDGDTCVPDEHAVDAMMCLLESHDGAVSAGPGLWEARISTRQSGPGEAVAAALDVVSDVAGLADMPKWKIVGVETIRQDLLDADYYDASLQGPR